MHKKWAGIAITVLTIAVVLAIIFRVPKLKGIVTGAA